MNFCVQRILVQVSDLTKEYSTIVLSFIKNVEHYQSEFVNITGGFLYSSFGYINATYSEEIGAINLYGQLKKMIMTINFYLILILRSLILQVLSINSEYIQVKM